MLSKRNNKMFVKLLKSVWDFSLYVVLIPPYMMKKPQ